MASRLFKQYNAFNEKAPYTTAFATGGVLWGAGNVFVKKVIERRDDKIERDRFAGCLFYGSTVTGPISCYYYNLLDSQVAKKFSFARGSRPFLFTKLAIELIVWQPFTMAIFFLILAQFQRKEFRESISELRSGFWSGCLVEWGVWLPVQSFNFTFVPVPLQVLTLNVGCLAESILLSILQQRNAKAQQ